MKIIISPSKKQNFDRLTKIDEVSYLDYEKTINLFSIINNMDKKTLAKKFNLKGQLLEETSKLYQLFEVNNKRAKAIDLYSGVAFDQINHHSYNDMEIDFLNKNLVILSAMYGAVKPFDYIWPYRLDFNVKLDQLDLYKYWEKEIDGFFKEEEIIINLASNEFSKLLKNQKDKFININFYEKKHNKLKVVSYNAKKARGLMVNEIVTKKILDPFKIKALIIDGYKYDKSSSNDKEFNFIKF